MHYLLLRAQRYRPGKCVQVLGIHRNTATQWSKLYLREGLAGLLRLKRYRPQSELRIHADTIAASFAQQAPRSVGQAAEQIKQLTGLKRGLTQVRHFIKSVLGLKCRRYRCLPGGSKPLAELAAEQAAFLHQTLQPLVEQARAEQIDLYFVDAAHPVQGFHSGQVWSRQPITVRTASGRQRVNILAALDAQHQELYSITTKDYIHAPTVVELLELLDQEGRTAAARRQDGQRRPIYLVLDNAPYQRCALVQEAARGLQLELVYLPAYSPNLNLIERFWKFLKQKALAGYYYATKQEFCDAIDWFIDEVNHGEYENELRTLLAPNFQTLKTSPGFSHPVAE